MTRACHDRAAVAVAVAPAEPDARTERTRAESVSVAGVTSRSDAEGASGWRARTTSAPRAAGRGRARSSGRAPLVVFGRIGDGVAQDDTTLAIAACHDAIRKALTAHMAANGLRPRGGEGAHRILLE